MLGHSDEVVQYSTLDPLQRPSQIPSLFGPSDTATGSSVELGSVAQVNFAQSGLTGADRPGNFRALASCAASGSSGFGWWCQQGPPTRSRLNAETAQGQHDA